MRNLIIRKRETISEILRFQSNELIDKTDVLAIDFDDETVGLYDINNKNIKTFPLGSSHIIRIENLLNN